MPFHIVEADLTQMDTDAIVNAANSQLLAGGGVCGAIFRAVGSRAGELQEACRKLAPCPTGEAVLTPGFGLKARYIIHAVGPIWYGGGQHEREKLSGCYQSALELALAHGCHSIAFPLISSGIFGYPKDQALQVARETICHFLASHDEELDVYLAFIDRYALELEKSLHEDLTDYIRMHHPVKADSKVCCDMESMDLKILQPRRKPLRKMALKQVMLPVPQDLKDALGHRQKSFSQQLLDLIDARGLKDSDVYKRANMDRKLFSKIRSHSDYHPTKKTVLALAVALGLDREETDQLLQTAGYSLSPSILADLIVAYFLERGKPDIYEIDAALFAYGQDEL